MADTEAARLFVIAEQYGQIITPDLDQSPFQVELDVRAGHLQNVITYLAALSRANGFIKHDTYQQAVGQRTATPTMRQNVELSRPTYLRQAKVEFLRASGLSKLVAVGALTEAAKKDEAREMFESFLAEYFGPRRYDEAQAFRRQLVATVDRIQEIKQTKNNRAEGLRPHRYKVLIEYEARRPGMLDTRKRLLAINGDPRAGFLPTTHREKNQVITFLDYLDNPRYPFGVNNQLIEVINKSERDKRKNPSIDSERGPLSITFEFIDYLNHSIQQLEDLEQIQMPIRALPNRRVTLGEEFEWLDLDHPGFKALIRFIDLSDFMAGAEVLGAKDPLKTLEIGRDNEKEKHKTVVDIYTTPEPDSYFEEYLKKRVRNTKVGEALDNIDLAIEDQLKRSGFMLRRLQDIASNSYGMSRLLQQMLQRTREVAAEAIAAAQAV
ncbi:MAG: hypothetical protein ACYCPS_01450 [Candidatus Saccharimonadales bacterium]